MDPLGPRSASPNFLPLKERHHARSLAGKLIADACDIPARLLREQVMIDDIVETLTKFDWDTWNKIYRIASALQNPTDADVTEKDKEWLRGLMEESVGAWDDVFVIDHIPNIGVMEHLLRDLAMDLGFHINEDWYPEPDREAWFAEIYEIIIRFVESETP